jgi:hypothetical protein
MLRRAALALFLLGALVLPVLPAAADDDGDGPDEGREDGRDGQEGGGERGGDGDGREDDREREGDDDNGDDDRRGDHDDEDGDGQDDGDDTDADGKQQSKRERKEQRERDRRDRGAARGHGARDRPDNDARDARDAPVTPPASPPLGAPRVPDDFVGPIEPGVLPDADLRVEQDYQLAGGMLAFTFLVANAGIEVATDVALHDELPAGDWTVADPRCSLDGDTLACALGDLPPGALASVTVATPLGDDAPDLANTVQATARRV